MSEVWAKWEGQVINGEFPLRRCLGVSDHSGVFLTDARLHNLPEAALKLVPLIPTLAESQLAHWNAAGTLVHPHLVRLFATGRCQLGNLHFLYVLMEYAEQNLAHLLRNRALADSEVHDLLPPALDALAFLHSHNMVQGQLKPSNILVVGDQLKLASDTIRPAGEATTSIRMSSVYDPPEGRDGSFSTAGDIWALGVTLYEALTQNTPEKPGDRMHGVVLPADFPPGSADVIQECLSRRPADRPTVGNLQAWVRVRPRHGTVAVPPVPAMHAAAGVSSASGSPGSAAASGSAGGAWSGVSQVATTAAVAESAAVAAEHARAARAEAQVPLPAAMEPVAAPTPEPVATAMGEAYLPPLGGPNDAAVASPAVQPSVTVPPAMPPPQPAPASAAASPAFTAAPGRLTIRAVVERDPPQVEPFQRRSFLPLVVGVVVIGAAVWFGARMFTGGGRAESPTPAVASAVDPAPPPAVASAPPVTEPPPPPRPAAAAAAPSEVVHEELPRVSHTSLATVHGKVKVVVRVMVDPSGAVIGETLTTPGPSQYFARVASEAARKWKFAPTAVKGPRQWNVHFEFSKGGVEGRAVGVRS